MTYLEEEVRRFDFISKVNVSNCVREVLEIPVAIERNLQDIHFTELGDVCSVNLVWNEICNEYSDKQYRRENFNGSKKLIHW